MATRTTVSNHSGNQLEMADSMIIQLFHRLLAHGHFSFTIDGAITKGGKRAVLIRAGEQHKFTIPVEDIPREYLPKDDS